MSEPLVSTQAAIEQLRRADERWGAAVRGLKPYAERLRELAEAAEHESRALTALRSGERQVEPAARGEEAQARLRG